MEFSRFLSFEGCHRFGKGQIPVILFGNNLNLTNLQTCAFPKKKKIVVCELIKKKLSVVHKHT
jgi:hypothetical protein